MHLALLTNWICQNICLGIFSPANYLVNFYKELQKEFADLEDKRYNFLDIS